MKSSLFLPTAFLASTLAQSTPNPLTTTNFQNPILNGTFGVAGPYNLRYDTGSYGPFVEEYHYFYDQWPIGLAISSSGRVFTCYTRGSYTYTLGEVVNKTAERAYPNQELNTVPGGLVNESASAAVGGTSFAPGWKEGFVSVQALYVTPDDTLWVLDTGRPTVNEMTEPVMPYAAPGGPKLVSINLSNNSISRTYTFPPTVHYPDSYLNDLRFDMRPNITSSGQGIAYLVDSSNEGRNGFIMVDLGTGESWRMLDEHPSVLRVSEDVPSYQGIPFYVRQPAGGGNVNVGFQLEGLDGIDLSLYGDVMYYSALTSDNLYSIETQYLRSNPSSNPLASKIAMDNVKNLGQRGGNANGFSSDSLGNIYMLMPSNNAIYIYNTSLHLATPYVRDPRIVWPDSANVGFDGYLYWNINQLPYQPMWNGGVDGRQKPGVMLRCRLPDGANKNLLLGGQSGNLTRAGNGSMFRKN